jgi:hypothetical protein
MNLYRDLVSFSFSHTGIAHYFPVQGKGSTTQNHWNDFSGLQEIATRNNSFKGRRH